MIQYDEMMRKQLANEAMMKGPTVKARTCDLKKERPVLSAFLLVVCVVALASGCAARVESSGDAEASPATQAQASPVQTPSPARPARVAPEELSKLSWIVGNWRGTGDIDKPFFETYRLEPGAIVVEGFEDEALTKSTGVTRFELKEGELGGGNDGWRWVVTKLEDGAVTFEPVVKARNSFRWERVSGDEWRAVLEWPATADRPARRRVYRMERWIPTTNAPAAPATPSATPAGTN
jgi:hypothetical protein